ncbi:MAG: hypothetical protein D3920_06520 [Candidatus Electrothrix sp. AW2]|nr:hypothetical protein [Candidatus Electrothrix gigas]
MKKTLLAVLILAAILFHVAGQIYLVAFVIKKARRANIFLRIVIGIFFFLFVNIPGLTASALLSESKMLPDQTAIHTLPWFFLSIVASSWAWGSPVSVLFNSSEIIGCCTNEKEQCKKEVFQQ